MALVAAIMMLTEEFARRLTANPFLLAVAGAALANVVVQTTFPYLTAVFLAQLCVAIVFLGALQRLAPAGKRGR
jgi:type III secretory pathway component EscV